MSWRTRVEARYRIVASRRTRYLEMFKGLPADPRNATVTVIKQVLDQALTLEREDRIMWYLRRWRDGLFLQAYWPGAQGKRDHDLTAQGLETNLQLLKKRLGPESTYPAKLNEFMAVQGQKFWRDLQHFLSNAKTNGLTSVLDFKFPPDMKPHDLLEHLKRIEGIDLEKSPARLLEPDDHERVITFPDGWAWWLLDQESCRQEGLAMRHCGNTANPRTGDQILSLREPIKRGGKTFWRPHATFIVNNGVLGEMKGYANQKPAAKLHPYIVKLLESDLVKVMNGGGYAADQNFSLDDLTEQERGRLLQHKPELAGIDQYIARHGFDQVVRDMLGSHMAGTPEWRGNDLVVEEFANLKDFAEKTGDRGLQYAVKVFDGDAEPYEFDRVDPNEREHFYDEYKKLKPEGWQRLVELARQDYSDVIDYIADREEVEPSEVLKNLDRYLYDNDFDDLNAAADNAIRDAYRLAAESELYKNVKDYLDGFDVGGLGLGWTHMDGPITVLAPPNVVGEALREGGYVDEYLQGFLTDKRSFVRDFDADVQPYVKSYADSFDYFEDSLPRSTPATEQPAPQP